MARVNKEVVRRQAFEHFPSFRRSRDQAIMLDAWIEGRQYEDARDSEGRHIGRPYTPHGADDEYLDLGRRAASPWGGLVVTSLAQTAYVDGIRLPGQNENTKAWEIMERNSWHRRQIAIHRAAIGHGSAFGVVYPGKDPLTGEKMAVMRGKSARQMAAFYDSDDDEWCQFAIEGEEYESPKPGEDGGWHVKFYDDDAIHYLDARGEGLDLEDWTYISYEENPLPVPQVARCANRLDTEGRTLGEIAPIIPLLSSVDQDKFDRLIVQRFGAWKVRYIAGMAKPTSEAEARMKALKMKIDDILISTNDQTKFGTLDATDLSGFIEAHDADLRVLAAITQTPPHHLLGLSSNLQAEALAAAESGLQRKSGDFKTNAGEFHEQMARMAAIIGGHAQEARAANLQVRWRDTESRSINQAADALFKLATGLKVPVEMLWERIPGWTDNDSERAKKLVESGDAIDRILAELAIEDAGETAKATAAAQPKPEPGSGNQD